LIPLSNPDIGESEIAAVVQVLRSSRLSLGPKLDEFEEAMTSYAGTAHAIGVSSGTAGLHLALNALGIGPGDEVILPSFTFVAAANAVLYQRATPVFADIDPQSLNLDPVQVEKAITSRTRAILVVHTFGQPADLTALLELAKRHGLLLIEDACEALGSEYRGRKVGGIGDVGVFSFYPNKPITMGEGGVLVTNDKVLAAKMRALRNQGRDSMDNWLQHSVLGYNYRLPEMNCALGLEQLKRLEWIIGHRESLLQRYCQMMQEICPEIELPARLPDVRVSRFAFVVKLPDRINRKHVMTHLAAQDIGCRDYFPAIHTMPLYSSYVRPENKLSVTEDIAARTLALPFFNRLTEDEMREVCHALRNW